MYIPYGQGVYLYVALYSVYRAQLDIWTFIRGRQGQGISGALHMCNLLGDLSAPEGQIFHMQVVQ